MSTSRDLSSVRRRSTSAATRGTTLDRYRRSGLSQRPLSEQAGQSRLDISTSRRPRAVDQYGKLTNMSLTGAFRN